MIDSSSCSTYSLVPNERPLAYQFWEILIKNGRTCHKLSSNNCLSIVCCQNYFPRPNAHFRPCFTPYEVTSRDHLRSPDYQDPPFIKHWESYIIKSACLCVCLSAICSPTMHTTARKLLQVTEWV